MTEPNPRNIPPFLRGQPLDASFRGKLNAMRRGVGKRITGLLGHESATSVATVNKLHSLRERIQVENRTGQTIPAFSLFAPSKSGIINYFWGPPVRTEAMGSDPQQVPKFESGLNYLTNYDRAIADGEGEWCQLVGELPVLIRYTISAPSQVPKIGHPVGPLGDGSVSVKRSGYVVIAEPDTENQRVWIVKSNDHLIACTISGTIKQGERGDILVHREQICSNESIKVSLTEQVEDPNKVTRDKPFVIEQVLNLTGLDLTDTFVVHYAKHILGVGLCILGEYDPIFKVEATECFYPNDTSDFIVLQLDTVSGDFVEIPNLVVSIKDDFGRFMLLPGEVVDALIYLDPSDCNSAKFKLIGSYGLTRQARVTESINCHSVGFVSIIDHERQGTTACDGGTVCPLLACNGSTNEEGRRPLFAGEIVTIHFLEDVWKIVAHPIATHAWAKLGATLCPDDQQATIDLSALDLVAYCPGVVTSSLPAVADNIRAGASGKSGDWVKFDIDLLITGPKLFVVTVKHHCKDVVVPDGSCGYSDAKFIRKKEGECAIEGHVLQKTSQMFCGDEEWTDQIELVTQVVMVDAEFASTGQGCDYGLTGDFVSLCTFLDGDGSPILDLPLGGTDFDTGTVYDNLSLEYDGGTDPSDGSDPCPEPTLTLKGRARAVIVCDDCDDSPDSSEACDVDDLSSLALEEVSAYYDAETTVDSEGRKCVVLIPISFITFAECDEGDEWDEIICGNPCPEDSGSEE